MRLVNKNFRTQKSGWKLKFGAKESISHLALAALPLKGGYFPEHSGSHSPPFETRGDSSVWSTSHVSCADQGT